MKISRRYLAQFRTGDQNQQGFMPIVATNLNKRRPSLKRHSRTQSKVQLSSADRTKSLSFDLVPPKQVVELKRDKNYLSYSESKTHHKRKSFQMQPIQNIRTITEPDVGSKDISVTLPGESTLLPINEHLNLLRKMLKSLQVYEMERRPDNVQKNAITYYNCKSTLQRYMDGFPLLIKKEFYTLLNTERCLVIVLMEICLLGKLQKYSKYIADTINKIIQQHRRFIIELGKVNKNESPNVSTLKMKFKMKTPGLIIKAENYKIYESFKMAMAPLDISQSMRQLTKNLEPTDPREFWYMLREFYAYYLCLKTLDKVLIRQDYWQFATCPQPYLPAYQGYTLVLDLDETLAYFNPSSSQVHIRPFTNEFLGMMRNYFQIVTFTAGMPDYAEYLISHIESRDCISYKLYRHHTSRLEVDKTIKDLDRLGRPLNQVIMVDNLPHNFSKQPLNGIQIKSWYGDPEDNELKKVMKHLIQIAQKQCDVRSYIRENVLTI